MYTYGDNIQLQGTMHRTYLPHDQRKKYHHGLMKLEDIHWYNPQSK